MFKNKYRIVTDGYAGYEAQVKYWWSPFWTQIGVNTRSYIEEAEQICKRHVQRVVKMVDVNG